MEAIPVTFKSGTGEAELHGLWHPPTSRATNGAVIVLPDWFSPKEGELYARLCAGAASLGLTALRFDFRFVGQTGPTSFDGRVQGQDDLLGAYNFLQSFGKEIKPRRFYLIGSSLGAAVALGLANNPAYAGNFQGVAALDLPLSEGSNLWPEGLPNLRAAVLLVQGKPVSVVATDEADQFLAHLPNSTRLEIIQGTGEGFVPLRWDFQPSRTPTPGLFQEKPNLDWGVELTLSWLAEQDKIREDLRK